MAIANPLRNTRKRSKRLCHNCLEEFFATASKKSIFCEFCTKAPKNSKNMLVAKELEKKLDGRPYYV